ncbi:MAG TPA: molybdopterin cofactor-binding domain-containing protein [Gemmataceae bacterium]|jgi:isoquinoline 1-oxidoreductase|nr:molybdopterin cofactor-binding domain-containing protein [Gemmataceae bacterium]
MSTSSLPEYEIEAERYEFFEAPRYQFEPDRREFLQRVGGGIVVALILTDALAAQQPGRGRGQGGGGGVPGELGAWLHIDEAGHVTVFTGKVEVGQNSRTSLSQVMAEELRLPVSAIEMVMADTDRVPYDAGTFGSATTPRMAPQIRQVGAAAREMLLDIAAEQGKVDRAALVIADGKITHEPTKQVFTFGSLTKGKKLTKTIRASKVTPASEWKVQGTSVPKVNARAIVTGKHHYTSDMKLPGMLYGKILRPEILNATVASVDLKPAEKLPGVVAVHDRDFVGVAAPTEFQAEQALAVIKAEWNPVPKLSDKNLFTELKTPEAGAAAGGGRGARGGGGRGGQTRGSIESGLKAADHKIEATYTIAYIAHTPLEPRAAVAEWKDGKLTVWTGTQAPFRTKSDLARVFGLAQDKVRVIVPDTGSGYGGKHTSEAAQEAARLAKAAGKPVKLVWTREEEFTWAYFRPAGVIDVTAGVKADGTITAWDFHNFNSGGSAIAPLYEIANQRNAFHNSHSPLKQGSYRGLAATANHFARECHIDDLAHAVKMDPLEFRLKNLKDSRLRAVLEAAAKQFGWGKSKPSADHGFGIAGGSEKGSYVATCAEIVHDQATSQVRVVRAVTAFECGGVLNPDLLKNQVEGAVVMGLGGALFEAIHFDEGKIQNASMRRYRVPRFSDVPILETVLLDRKDLPPAGAGETPIVAIAPAVGNAIFQATGIRRRSLPMVPEGLKA